MCVREREKERERERVGEIRACLVVARGARVQYRPLQVHLCAKALARARIVPCVLHQGGEVRPALLGRGRVEPLYDLC